MKVLNLIRENDALKAIVIVFSAIVIATLFAISMYVFGVLIGWLLPSLIILIFLNFLIEKNL